MARMKPSDAPIRPATAADLDALVALAAAFRDFLGDQAPSDAAFRAGFARLLADPTALYLLAPPARGYVALRFRDSAWHQGPECEVEDVFVHPDARGTGLGRGLMAAAIAAATTRGARAIGLTTNERNAAAVALYEGLGLTAARPRWDGGRQLWLQRSLPG